MVNVLYLYSAFLSHQTKYFTIFTSHALMLKDTLTQRQEELGNRTLQPCCKWPLPPEP